VKGSDLNVQLNGIHGDEECHLPGQPPGYKRKRNVRMSDKVLVE
jgi:hypothetical protein